MRKLIEITYDAMRVAILFFASFFPACKHNKYLYIFIY